MKVIEEFGGILTLLFSVFTMIYVSITVNLAKKENPPKWQKEFVVNSSMIYLVTTLLIMLFALYSVYDGLR